MLFCETNKFFSKNFSCSYVGNVGIMLCHKSSKPNLPAINSYLSNPSIAIAFADSSKSRGIATTYYSIKIIFASRRFAQIFPAIISLIAVYVVNVLFWPTARHHKKNYAVQVVSPDCVGTQCETDAAIAAKMIGSSNAAYRSSLRTTNFPSDNACFSVVRKLRSYKFRRNIVAWRCVAWFYMLSHSILLRSGRLEAGQGVLGAFLPRYSMGTKNAQ